MGCNASNHPPNSNSSVRSTSYSIFRRCRRRKKNKEDQNEEYNDEELKRKIDMVSSGNAGDEANKDISLSHHGFNFLGNSFSKNYFKGSGGTGGGGNAAGEFYEEGEQDDLNNKTRGGGAGGSGIFVNVPLLAQSQASSSQLDFFRMLDQKIQEGPDYETPSSSCCSSDGELEDAGGGCPVEWNDSRPKSCSKNHQHHPHHKHYHLLHQEAKDRWNPTATVDNQPSGYNHVNCIIQTNNKCSTEAADVTPPSSSSPLVGGVGGILNKSKLTYSSSSGGGCSKGPNNNLFSSTTTTNINATVISNNSAVLKDFFMNDKSNSRDSQC